MFGAEIAAIEPRSTAMDPPPQLVIRQLAKSKNVQSERTFGRVPHERTACIDAPRRGYPREPNAREFRLQCAKDYRVLAS